MQSVTEKSFAPYGRVLKGYDIEQMCKVMEEQTPLGEEVIYVPSMKALEELSVGKQFCQEAFGELPIQIGYCNGHNVMLNALEYHRCSEINVAITDMILLVGRQQDIEDGDRYDTQKVEAFLVPKGTVVEVYATTLHYAPCQVDDRGFRCVVILPKGTNEPLSCSHANEGEDRLLTAVNKWLLAHKDAHIQGSVCGLYGENISVEHIK